MATFVVAHHLEKKGSEVTNKGLLPRRDDNSIFHVSKEVHIDLVQRASRFFQIIEDNRGD
jgi:hypothetical protein